MADYKIVKGDTLSKIAKKFGTTVQALAQANNIKDVNKIRAGATLVIPGTTASAPTPAASPAAAEAPSPVPTPQQQADAANAALDAQRNQTNRQLFRQVMGAYFNLQTEGVWIDALFDNAKKYYDQDITGDTAVELLLREDNAPAAFKNRFSAYLNINNKRLAEGKPPEFGNISEYIQTEKAYLNKLTSYKGFESLATQDNIKKFIEGEVAVDEVGRRIDNAYYAINTADSALKAQIKQQFPSLTDDDLAKSLVTGSTDSIQQKIKFGAAEIATEAQAAGIQAQSNLEDLTKQGVTRDVARKVFQNMAQEQAGIAQASRIFNQDVTQQQLEQEAFGIKPSETAKGLRSQARAEFAGQSGIVTGSLGRRKRSSQL